MDVYVRNATLDRVAGKSALERWLQDRQTRLEVAELLQLKPNDVIPLQRNFEESVEIEIGGQCPPRCGPAGRCSSWPRRPPTPSSTSASRTAPGSRR